MHRLNGILGDKRILDTLYKARLLVRIYVKPDIWDIYYRIEFFSPSSAI